jgi:hypothetical protein
VHGKFWTEAEERLLGTMPDEALAQKLDRAVRSAQHRRADLGIPKVY